MKAGDDPVRLARDVVPWSFALLAVLAALLTDPRIPGLEFAPWVVGLLFFGLPHGACDHLVAARLSGRGSPADIAVFFALYLATMSVVLVLWFVSPPVALASFLALTAWHWGSADAMTFRPEGFARFYAESVSRGLLVMSAPVAFAPGESWNAFGAVMSSLGRAASGEPVWLQPLAVGLLVSAVAVECVLLFLDFARKRTSAGVGGALELLLLLGLFYALTPVAAVGVYFVFWHAWRHVLRVGELLGPWKSGRERGVLAVVSGYHLRALPLAVLSLVMLVALSVAVGASDPSRLAGVYLVLISALTLPHAVLVFLWDYRTIRLRSRTG